MRCCVRQEGGGEHAAEVRAEAGAAQDADVVKTPCT